MSRASREANRRYLNQPHHWSRRDDSAALLRAPEARLPPCTGLCGAVSHTARRGGGHWPGRCGLWTLFCAALVGGTDTGGVSCSPTESLKTLVGLHTPY